MIGVDAKCRWDNGTLWFSVNSCVGTFGVGYLGHLYYGMGIRDAALTIVFFNLLSCAPVAYMCTFGKVCGRLFLHIRHPIYDVLIMRANS